MKNFYKYLPLTDTEKKWNFYITTVGYTLTHPGEAYPPKSDHPKSHLFTWNKGRILNGYYLVFISRGEGVFESALTKPKKIKEGTCFFLYPKIWHRYKPNLQTGWEEYWVGFNGIYPHYLMNRTFFSKTNPFLEVGLNESLLILFRRLIDTVQNGTPGYHQIIAGITLEMLGQVHTISVHKRQSHNKDKQLINKSLFLLRESLDKPLDIHKLVLKLPMGYSKFRKLFKTETGYSPNEYHLMMRMEKAKELLKTTELHIREIGYQTGFDSEFYFSRIFKKKNGISPKEYRLSEV